MRGALAAVAVLAALPVAARAVDGSLSANELFGAMATPTQERAPDAIGSYARGCLQGAVQLPVDGPGWQVVRLSRNRNWGHPALIGFIERLAAEVRRSGAPGLLVGDMAQPRGGPLRFGHASHQIGLDVDIWLIPPPNRLLSPGEREQISATSMLKPGEYSIDPARFGRYQTELIRQAASHPEVERVFVNPGIKQALCIATAGQDRTWLHKVRPWYGHDDHIHVRLQCPAGDGHCETQKPVPAGDGCGADLAWWLTRTPITLPTLSQPARPLALSSLPSACKAILRGP